MATATEQTQAPVTFWSPASGYTVTLRLERAVVDETNRLRIIPPADGKMVARFTETMSGSQYTTSNKFEIDRLRELAKTDRYLFETGQAEKLPPALVKRKAHHVGIPS